MQGSREAVCSAIAGARAERVVWGGFPEPERAVRDSRSPEGVARKVLFAQKVLLAQKVLPVWKNLLARARLPARARIRRIC